MKDRLRILYLIDHFETNYPRDQNYIIRFMMERGHDVEILTSRNPKFEQYDPIFFPRVRISRCPIILRIRDARVYLCPTPVKFLRKHDVVHSFTFFTFSSMYAILARSYIKLIRSEIGPPYGLNFAKGKRGIYSLLLRTYKYHYSYFTVYNELEKKSLELLGFPRERILVLPLMIDFDIFSTLQRKLNDDKISIGVIARISPEKGVHKLIPIMREVLKIMPTARNKLKLILAGRINDQDYAKKILSTLQTLLASNFVYLGEVVSPYSFYETVDVVIVPSLIETGAITVLEAMAAGKCVIASNIYPINLYITSGHNGFLFNTASEAAKFVIDILENTVDLKSISKEAKKYARKHDYKVVCRKLEEAYYSAIP